MTPLAAVQTTEFADTLFGSAKVERLSATADQASCSCGCYCDTYLAKSANYSGDRNTTSGSMPPVD